MDNVLALHPEAWRLILGVHTILLMWLRFIDSLEQWTEAWYCQSNPPSICQWIASSGILSYVLCHCPSDSKINLATIRNSFERSCKTNWLTILGIYWRINVQIYKAQPCSNIHTHIPMTEHLLSSALRFKLNHTILSTSRAESRNDSCKLLEEFLWDCLFQNHFKLVL